jgi:hypothetical protein
VTTRMAREAGTRLILDGPLEKSFPCDCSLPRTINTNGQAMLVAPLHHQHHHRLLLLQIIVGTTLISKSAVKVVVEAVIVAADVRERLGEGPTEIGTAATWP